MHRLITLLTDFGLEDEYVGVMKGVILGIAPEVTIVDLAHGIGRHAIGEAAFVLAGSIRYFPRETIHLVVVDPGVGGERRPIAVQTERAFYVGPDNGVLSLALEEDPPLRVVELSNPQYRLENVSRTFHGRDIFAPAAAHLARGVPICELGSVTHGFVKLSFPKIRVHPDGTLEGAVVHIDHFGNCITNIPARMVGISDTSVRFEVGTAVIEGLSASYSSVAPGHPLAIVGSAGYVEFAVREASAAERLGLKLNSPVLCHQRPTSPTGRQA